MSEKSYINEISPFGRNDTDPSFRREVQGRTGIAVTGYAGAIKPASSRKASINTSSFPRMREPSQKITAIGGHYLLAVTLAFVVMIETMSSALAADPPEGPNLGHPVTEEDITRHDMSIMPNGEGLPEGQGSVAEGEALYKQHCVSCHGQGGLGNSGDQLAGAMHSLTDEWPEKTIGTYWPYATTLFDFIRRSMPMNAPGTLTNAEVYALVAYLLYLNGIIEEGAVMNAEALKQIKMPNADGFINVYEKKEEKQ